jgi:hypothetical protein
LVVKAGAREMEEFTFPSFEYYVDESDPDVVILRRQDGSYVAAFSARGVTNEGIIEAATEDRRELFRSCNRCACEIGNHRPKWDRNGRE